jgi:hypothetical protein
MNRTTAVAFIVAFCTIVTGCGESKAQEEARMKTNLKILGEKYVKEKLKDPDSAQFQNQFIGIKGAPCGEVNSKNSFGGYGGFKRYISVGRELTVLESDSNPTEFDATWRQICK